MMSNRITIITDAWHPQINGVVTTISNTKKELEKMGFEVTILSSLQEGIKTFQAPKYPGVNLALNPWKIINMIDESSFIHISTEGPLGISSSVYLGRCGIPFTSAYHTKTPEFLKQVWKIPLTIGYSLMKFHHKNSKALLVTTEEMAHLLFQKNINSKMVVWGRGVDCNLFHPKHRTKMSSKKILLYVGRVSKEKNMESFLSLQIPGTLKIVVGDGPEKKNYESQYPDTIFVGFKTGIELAKYYASADVFVFPSKWDTFGVVQNEAAACGTPIARFNDFSAKGILVDGINGFAKESLKESVEECFSLDRDIVRQHTISHFSWETCTKIFLNALQDK